MAIMRRITEINGEIIMVETMIGNIILCTIHINGELVKYEILSVAGQKLTNFRIVMNRLDWRIVP